MKTLLIIDIQNDFLPSGALAVTGGDSIISVVNELMPHYDHVVATQDYHPIHHGSFAANHSGKNVGEMIELSGLPQILWPTHCVQGTTGADFAAELHTQRFDTVFRKGTDSTIDSCSGFYDNGHLKSTGLAEYLKQIKTSELHLVGLATDYCVRFTALDAITEGFKTTLIVDSVRGVNLQPNDCKIAIQEMAEAGVRLVSSDDILGETHK